MFTWRGAFNPPRDTKNADDVRFTTKDGVLYVIVLGKPTPPLRNRSLGTTAALLEKLIASIGRLGSDERVMWSRAADALPSRRRRFSPKPVGQASSCPLLSLRPPSLQRLQARAAARPSPHPLTVWPVQVAAPAPSFPRSLLPASLLMTSTEIKIAHIGGGSRYWARELLSELAQSPRLTGSVALHDLNHAAAEKNVAIAAAIFRRPEAKARFAVRAVRRLADALRGADVVVLSIEPGPTSMRYADLVIPARYGILQTVGDTTGPGGILRGLRSVSLYSEFARAIAEHCPKAWVINYTNPMTLCTAALYAETPSIKAFGCCHEVFHTQERLAKFVAEWFGVAVPARQEIAIELNGINHFTWVTRATWKNRDLLSRLRAHTVERATFRSQAAFARANRRAQRWFTSAHLVAFDLFRRFGALGAAGDRHLAEFVPWYATDEATLHRWGVVATPYAWRLQRSRQKDHSLAHYEKLPLRPSIEEGVKLIEAISGHTPIDTNVNLPNRGQSPDLPLGHIVETNAQFSRDCVSPLTTRPLPPGALALVRRVVDVQQLTLQAARTRDVDLAFQAVLADPLTRIPTDDAWRMFQAMLAHARPMLPGWRLP